MVLGLESWTLARPELFLAAVTAMLLIYGVVRGEAATAFVSVATSAALLATAVLLFLPCGGYALAIISAAPGVTAPTHVVALGVVLLLHVAILVHVKRRDAALSGT